MSTPDLCDIATRCHGELPSGNGTPSSQGGRQRRPLERAAVSLRLSLDSPIATAAAGRDKPPWPGPG